MTFDPREIANMLDSRGASVECSACGEDMKVIGQSGYLLYVDTPGSSQALDVAAVVCANCGHVRLHATKAFDPTFNSDPEAPLP